MDKDAFAYPELHYFKSGNTYSGSYKGLNYKLTPDGETLHIVIWYGMYCSAVSEMRSIVVLPMPRRGVLMIRMQLTSSAGLSMSLRYAVTSLISARSKNRVPPTMR